MIGGVQQTDGLLAQTGSETFVDEPCDGSGDCCDGGCDHDTDVGVENRPHWGTQPCDCECDDYYCPPCLDKCPGVLQPPGPCIIALKEKPLCYQNNGWMKTSWGHEVGVDKYGCKNEIPKISHPDYNIDYPADDHYYYAGAEQPDEP